MTCGKVVTALVISAPHHREKQGQPSFETIFTTGKGPEYAIPLGYISKLTQDSLVIVLRQDRDVKRAKGRLTKLKRTGKKTPQGIMLYDVYFEGQKSVPFKRENLHRWGTALIWTSWEDC